MEPDRRQIVAGNDGRAVTSSSTSSLGGLLRQARELQQKSISIVAKEAEISTAYLQKLEVNDVRQPSPNVLHSLSSVLNIDYGELMRLASYTVPNESDTQKRCRNELTHALSSEELTEEEANELAEYLMWYRTRRQRTPK